MEEHTQEEQIVADPKKRYHILVVDDDIVSLEVMKRKIMRMVDQHSDFIGELFCALRDNKSQMDNTQTSCDTGRLLLLLHNVTKATIQAYELNRVSMTGCSRHVFFSAVRRCES